MFGPVEPRALAGEPPVSTSLSLAPMAKVTAAVGFNLFLYQAAVHL